MIKSNLNINAASGNSSLYNTQKISSEYLAPSGLMSSVQTATQ